ncbi:MAG: hypothetical protein WBQ60_02055 [Asticcacaulis sp.]
MSRAPPSHDTGPDPRPATRPGPVFTQRPNLPESAQSALRDSEFTVSREVRNLANLNRTWSSCRVLNLAKIYTLYKDNPDYAARPLFEHSLLNHALIIKHTLRIDERDLFPNGRRTVTKIILPYDPYDLRLGGRAFFVRQTQYETLMRNYLGIDNLSKNRDAKVLACLDGLPSLDPFLLREHLDKAGFDASACYFQVSTSDLKAMMSFTAQEIENLVHVALGPQGQTPQGRMPEGGQSKGATRLGHKILSDKLNQSLIPLQKTLHMSDEEFHEGIMCWRGFLYYKWCHAELQAGLRDVLGWLGSYRAKSSHDEAMRTYLKTARPRIARRIVAVIQDTQSTLERYDQVYHALAVKRDPEPFRQFLLFGSEQFIELGQKIGTLNHIVSFWKFRLAKINAKGAKPLQDIEFADILIDFDASLFRSLEPDIMRERR